MSSKLLSQKLRQHDINPSYQRIVILEYILECSDNGIHPTSEEVFDGLQEKNKIISKATVYNTLKTFEEQGLIKLINLDGKINRYEYNSYEHGHFLCTECGKIYDVELPKESLDTNLNGFTVVKSDVNFTGICSECNQKKLKLENEQSEEETMHAQYK